MLVHWWCIYKICMEYLYDIYIKEGMIKEFSDKEKLDFIAGLENVNKKINNNSKYKYIINNYHDCVFIAVNEDVFSQALTKKRLHTITKEIGVKNDSYREKGLFCEYIINLYLGGNAIQKENWPFYEKVGKTMSYNIEDLNCLDLSLGVKSSKLLAENNHIINLNTSYDEIIVSYVTKSEIKETNLIFEDYDYFFVIQGVLLSKIIEDNLSYLLGVKKISLDNKNKKEISSIFYDTLIPINKYMNKLKGSLNNMKLHNNVSEKNNNNVGIGALFKMVRQFNGLYNNKGKNSNLSKEFNDNMVIHSLSNSEWNAYKHADNYDSLSQFIVITDVKDGCYIFQYILFENKINPASVEGKIIKNCEIKFDTSLLNSGEKTLEDYFKEYDINNNLIISVGFIDFIRLFCSNSKVDKNYKYIDFEEYLEICGFEDSSLKLHSKMREFKSIFHKEVLICIAKALDDSMKDVYPKFKTSKFSDNFSKLLDIINDNAIFNDAASVDIKFLPIIVLFNYMVRATYNNKINKDAKKRLETFYNLNDSHRIRENHIISSFGELKKDGEFVEKKVIEEYSKNVNSVLSDAKEEEKKQSDIVGYKDSFLSTLEKNDEELENLKMFLQANKALNNGGTVNCIKLNFANPDIRLFKDSSYDFMCYEMVVEKLNSITGKDKAFFLSKLADICA